MKAGWEVRPLKDLCHDYRQDIVDGPFGANLKREHFVESGVPVLKIQNIKPFRIIEKKMSFITPQKANELARHAYNEGDIIVTKLGVPLGVSAKVPEGKRGVIVADLVRVRAQKVDTNFLCYQLNSPRVSEYLNDLSEGATRPRVRIVALRDLPLVVPPLEEQKRIVAVLDEAFEGLNRARENTETNLTNARELFESIKQHKFFRELSFFPTSKLDEVCQFRNGRAHEKSIDADGKYVVVNSKFVSSDGEIRKYTGSMMSPLSVGEIALVMSDVPNGKTLGKCFLIDEDYRYSLNQRVCVISSEVFEAEFLYFQLNRNRHFLKYNNGENQTNLRKAEILACPLYLPPRASQRKMADELTELRNETCRLVWEVETKLTDLEDLRQSLLQKAFAGELT